MREILFRGKEILSNKWIYGLFAKIKKHGNRKLATMSHQYGVQEVWHDTIGQYTGLKDNEGKKIFEGDIVEASIYADEKPAALEVYQHNGCYIIDYEDSDANFTLIGWFGGSLKIIGNKFENPDLLSKNE